MKNYLTASISVSAVRHNIALLREQIGSGVQLCPAVKDDCYGHGVDVLYPVLCSVCFLPILMSWRCRTSWCANLLHKR